MSTKNTFLKPNAFLLFIVIYTTVYFILILLFRENKFQQFSIGIWSLLSPAITSMLLYRQWKREDQRERMFWGFLFFGSISYFIGQCLTTVYHFLFFNDPSYPSIVDIFFLLHLILFLLGFISFVSRYENKIGMSVVFTDIFITIIVLSIICWLLFIEPIYSLNPAPRFEIIVSIAYPLFALLILFGLFHIRFLLNSKPFSSLTMNSLTVATFLNYVTNCLFLYFSANDLYSFGSILDPLWSLALLLIGLSSLSNQPVYDNRTFAWVKKYLNQNTLHIMSIIALSILFVPHVLTTDVFLFLFVVGILLILFRQFLMLKQNKELTRLLNETMRKLEVKNEKLKKTVRKLESLNRLREMEAKTDYLTGVYNRRFIEQLMHAFIKDADCHATPFSVLLIDVDHFKSVNDKFGHDLGDKILFKFAYLLQRTIRKSDVVGRLGGEEFIVLLPNTETNTAFEIGEQLRQYIEQYIFHFDEIEIHITISVGVASWKPGDTFDDLYKRVDHALYEAKNTRNKVVCHTS
ncbi:GGDEF domain-containing protein [Fervidibacillus albus]|uniref:GGDEF domain-containing protein n=1 Tax=Fervidibacillus albus TaxID=2980026 RepID=A0A9E8LSY9_9BACI|nr:GGDEF domain-containing protein [Fervidibacillus albus]WAA09040.1 GGDEF domain-containing protein [Fervidibacillus albus]